MVGTFYRSSAPDKPPYVQVGDTVGPETVVCIVEAMKLMNEIKAGLHGKVVELCVANETAVKAGQALFQVSPS
jgi:acetyl-CoA carboxylase biotin carboxyl carrier protein